MFLFFQINYGFNRYSLMKTTFSKPLAIIKPPNNKNTTGLAYDEKIDLVLNSIKNGEINIGIKAVIDRGIASLSKKIIVMSICKTILEFKSRFASKPKILGRKPSNIPIVKIKFHFI